MDRTESFIEFFSPLHLPGGLPNDTTDSNGEKGLWDSHSTPDHPLLTTIRKAVTKYRMQSAAHFNITINVKQGIRLQDMDLKLQSRVDVVFADYQGSDCFTCRPVFRKLSSKKSQVFTGKVEVYDGRRLMPLKVFLSKRFPSYPDAVGIQEMQTWWNANGKRFSWATLPTELKEHVITFCIHQPLKQSDKYRKNLHRYHNRFVSYQSPELGVYEIVDKLTDWAALLGVSHQMRAIALRLCFVGSSDMSQGKGFSIGTASCCGLDKTLRRLGRYYSMVEANALPIDDETQSLAYWYKQYPRIYKQLHQYTTFRHGIRHIGMSMCFFDYMQFFKVTVGNFERYIKPGSISYEVFDQLPHLSEIAVKLPGRPRRGWSSALGRGPVLFHNDSPCPRILHRIIYERVLDVLNPLPRLTVLGFVDDDEKQRFDDLHALILKTPRWTAAEFEELYDECGGGIILEESVSPGSWSVGAEIEQIEPVAVEEPIEDFFPPKCRCEAKCHLLLG